MYDVINSPRARGIIMPGGGEVSSVALTAPPVTASPAAKGCRRVGGELDVSRKDERTQSNLTVRMFHVTPPSLGIPEGGHLSLFRAYVCKENYERIYRVCVLVTRRAPTLRRPRPLETRTVARVIYTSAAKSSANIVIVRSFVSVKRPIRTFIKVAISPKTRCTPEPPPVFKNAKYN